MLALWLILGALVVLYAIGLILALDAIWNARTAQGTIAWVFALVLLAPVAVVFYFVFGTRRFYGYVRARRRGNARLHKLAAEVFERLKPFAAPRAETSVAPAAGSMDFLGLLPVTSGNTAELLIDGEATFGAIFAELAQAHTYALVQFYIINDDHLGRKLLDALAGLVKRGVACRVLYDEVGSKKMTKRYLADARAAGIDLRAFRTRKGPKNRFQINFRNHRKIVIVDGRVAFVGGHNVGDEYLGREKRFSPWRDTHVCLRGPSVQAVQLAFVEDWHWATHEVPALEWQPQAVAAANPGTRVMIVPSGPADDVETFLLLFLHLAGTARERLWIASPYFVPDEAVLSALQLAALRGVDVRVIIPERADAVLVWRAAFSFYPEVLPTGVKLYRYHDGFMHQKVIVADDLAAVGTANLDNRSLRINFEITAVVADASFADDAAAMLEADFSRCRRVPDDAWRRMGVMSRLSSRMARLFAPIL